MTNWLIPANHRPEYNNQSRVASVLGRRNKEVLVLVEFKTTAKRVTV